MKTTVLFLTVLGCTLAVPNGYYHQEYNYKTSSSSYKNNELQHKTDDQGYYRKDGDLEGRVRPKVDANSEHSEYVNPNLRNGDYRTGLVGAPNGDLSSYGHMRANLGSYGSRDLAAEGLAHSDHITGYSSGSYGAANRYGSSAQYGVSSNLGSVTSRIQQELEGDLQRAIQENRAYSQSSQLGINELERELKQNLTNRLNTELLSKYGQQSIRGGLSYTISDGRLHSTANYDNQELLDLRRQLENSLLNQLRSQYNQAYAGSSNSRYESVHGSSQSSYGYAATTVRPAFFANYPTTTSRPFTTVIPTYPINYNNANYIRYTPVPNPESITTIALRVQNQLDTRLNQILDDVQRRYFSSSSSYSLTNSDVLLDRLRNELRSNITYQLNEDISRNYGTQIQRDGHMYTVGPSGQTSSQYNYSLRDLENLRSQIERNLIEKLNRDFERYRTSWSQQYSQSGHSSHQSYGEYNSPRYDIYSTPKYVHTTPRYDVYSTPRYDVYSTPRYDVYSTPRYNTHDSEVEHLSTRPSSSHITSLITGTGGSSSQNRHYLVAGSGQSGYEVSGSSSNSMSQLQRQLQEDLSRQLQAAISRGHYGSYSSSGSYNPQSYQASLQQLTDELNRNLTRQLQEYSSSSYYSTYGNVDQAQLANLRNQLQADLTRQLQQGLQQSYHSSSSYSSSSSSSNANYRPTRGFQNYQLGQYKTGGNVATFQGEDCLGDDPNAYTSHRMKRSYQPYRSRPIGLASYSGGYGSSGSPSYGYGGNYIGDGGFGSSYDRRNNPQVGQQQVEELGQEVDESDLTQQVEDAGYGRLQSQNQQQIQLGQQVVDPDQTQQVEDPGFGKLQLGSQSQQQIELGQQTENSDEIQQREDYGKLQLGSQNQQQIELGQQVEDSDLTQQVEDSRFGKLQVGQQNQQQIVLGQQIEDSDDTQQVEDSGFGKLQLGTQGHQQIQLGQQVDDSGETQQVEHSGFEKLQLGSQSQQQVQLGQQVDDSYLTQQVEDSRLGKLHTGLEDQQQTDLGQQVQVSGYGKLQGQQSQRQIELGQAEDSDQAQQEELGIGKLQLGSQSQQQIQLGQQVEDSGETQQVEDSGFGKLQLGSQSQQQIELGQRVEDSGETQQVEDSGFGNLQLGTQSQQQIQLGQQVDDSYLTQQVQRGKLQLGSQTQQQIEGGQQIDDTDLTQQAENIRLGKLQFASQQSEPQDNYDLTQQLEYPGTGQLQIPQTEFGQDLTQQRTENTGRLQFGSQGQQQITVGQPKFTQQQIQIANQLENELSKQLKEAIRNQQHEVIYSISDESPSQSYQVSYQQLSNQLLRNLSKQLQDVVPGANRYGPRYSYTYTGNFNDQQLTELREKLENDLLKKLQNDLSQSFSYSASWGSSTNSQNNLGTLSEGNFKNFNQNQIQTANQLEKQLSNKLRDAVRTRYYTITYSGTGSVQPQLLYQNLINELQRNLTKELQAVGPTSTSYSYSYTFNKQQLNELRKQLEHDLKLQLEKEVSSITTNNLSQQPIDNSGLTQKQTIDPDLTQQVENSDLIQQTEDNAFGTPEVSNQLQFDNIGQQANVNSFITPQVEGQSTLQNLNANQVQFVQQLGGDLSSQLRNGIKTYYSSTYTAQPFVTVYKQLLNDLQRNITNQLQEIRTGHTRGRYSYSTYHSFTDEQLASLRKQIENNLKFQLQNEILSYGQQSSNWQQVGSHRGDISVQLGGPLQTGQKQDISQQTEDNTLGNNQQQTEFGPGEDYDLTQQGEDNSHSRLQYGNQQTEQQSLNLDNQFQQVVDNKLGPQQFGQQQVIQPIEPERIYQTQQTEKSQAPVTQEQIDLNQQVDIDYPTPLRIPSANLQLGNRPVTRRPVDSNRFLQTEIDQQQQNLLDANLQAPSQQQVNQQPVDLPTLNQVIQQNHDVTDSSEYNTELPDRAEPSGVSENKNDLIRQIEQVDGDVSQNQRPFLSQTTSTSDQNREIFTSGSRGQIQTLQPTGGQTQILQPTRGQTQTLQPTGQQTFKITNQEQFITQPQSLTDAEREGDLLIQNLREYQQNRPSQSTSDERPTYIQYNQPTRQGGYGGYKYTGGGSGSYGTHISSVQFAPEQEINQQGSFEVGLNPQQIQFAKQLENELSKQLQEAVSQNYQFVTQSNSGSPSLQLYQVSYQLLSEDLQRNLTKQLEEMLNGSRQHGSSSFSYSVYGSLSNQQRQTLLNRLLADLLRQLQQNLQVSYGLQHTSNYDVHDFNGEYSSSSVGSSGHGYRVRGQIHHGQPEQIQQNFETTSDLKQIEPQHANVIQSVAPQDGSIGLKGRKGLDIQPAGVSTPSSPPPPPPRASIVTQGIVEQDETRPNVEGENVPWWQRIGSKVRQSAHDLKEKIIG